MTHGGPTGGMSNVDRERALRSAAARADNWPTQREKERDVVSLVSVRRNAEDYTPNHSARRERYQLERAPTLSLELVQQGTASQAAAPVQQEPARIVNYRPYRRVNVVGHATETVISCYDSASFGSVNRS